MSEKAFLVTITWILSWLVFAFNQLGITYNYLTTDMQSVATVNQINTQNTEDYSQIQSTEDRTNTVESKNVYNVCEDDKFWGEISAEISKDKKNINLMFPSTPRDNDIRSLKLVIQPNSIYNYESSRNAYHMHAISSLPIDIKTKNHSFNIKLLSGVDADYTYLINDWKLNLVASSKNNIDCYDSTLLTINSLNYNNIQKLPVYYQDNVIGSVYEANYDVRKIGEQAYLDNFFQKRELKTINKLLPPPHEAALALLNKDVRYGEEKYVTEYIFDKHRLHGKVFVGLFGDVKEEDLQTISTMLELLNIVAPQLDISYSANPKNVNLPIHFAPCTEVFSDIVNDCKRKYAGIYYRSNSTLNTAEHGWIWVDSNYSSSYRKHVLIHEFGHALGLGHNLCTDSVMSYADWAESVTYFTEVDLMQLRLLYDSNLPMIFSNYQVVNDLNFDSDIYQDYLDNEKPMCSPQQSGWDELISFQKGEVTVDQILQGGNK